jgi:hypothetical protein
MPCARLRLAQGIGSVPPPDSREWLAGRAGAAAGALARRHEAGGIRAGRFPPRAGNRGGLAWGAGGGDERPCSPARSWRNPTRMSRPPTDPRRLVFSFATFTSWSAAIPKSDRGWRLHAESERPAGTSYYPWPISSLMDHTILCSSTDDSKPELAGASLPHSRRPGRTLTVVEHEEANRPCQRRPRHPSPKLTMRA